MKVKEIPFEEEFHQLDPESNFANFFAFSPAGKVPVLHHNGLVIPESLAILEYLAELYPAKGFWPEDQASRAIARAVSHEMHGGFNALRSQCLMNMRRTPAPIPMNDALTKDVRRVEQIWDDCLQASGGPFLFGAFTNADAMYAPVVNRFEIFQLSQTDTTTRYSGTIKTLPAWTEWADVGHAEPWTEEMNEA